MEKSYDASKSESSSEEEWMDLGKSYYAKVIFSNLYWNSVTGDVGCYFALTETVSKSPLDYIGIYKVGYDNLSQCLAFKNVSVFGCEDDSKPIHCGFKSEELPELNGFYQFLYVAYEKEVCGASMPFEVKLTHKKDLSLEEVVTERIENDFQIVRYGLELKNNELKTLLKTHQSENVVLVTKIRELRGEKAVLTQKLEETRQTLHSVTQELIEFKAAKIKELDLIKAESAAAVEKCYRDQQDNFEAIKAELDHARDKAVNLSQTNQKIEEMYLKVLLCSANFDARIKEKEDLLTESKKIIRDLREEIKCKENDIEKIKQLNYDSSKAKDLTIEKYRKTNDQLNLKIEKLKADFNLKENLHKNLLKFPKPSHHAFTTSNTVQGTEDDHLVVEQLEDAKFMIKALEDSKHLAMKEMHELSEKLKKTKEELSQLRCENMALKIFLESKTSEENKNHADKNIQAQTENVLLNLLPKLKETDPTVDMDNLEQKLMNLIVHTQHQTEEISKGKVESSLLKCENMALKIFLEAKTCCGTSKETAGDKISDKKENDKHSEKEIQVDNGLMTSEKTTEDKISEKEKNDKYSEKEVQVDNGLMNLLSPLREVDPAIDVDNAEEKLKTLVINKQHQTELISKLKEGCSQKEGEIKSLKKELDTQKRTTVEALLNVEDKTARIVVAAELYKDLYKEKERFAKLLKKVTSKAKSKKSSIPKYEDEYKFNFLPNIGKSAACSDSTSNNSDSDTGEHVRRQNMYPDVEKIVECLLPKQQVRDYSSEDLKLQYSNVWGRDDRVCKTTSEQKSLGIQPLSLTDHIPCVMCGKVFLTTPHCNLPMIEHMEKVHNINVCPLCGQLFDRSLPPRYFMFHVDDHY